jgi:WD40 repeat protein
MELAGGTEKGRIVTPEIVARMALAPDDGSIAVLGKSGAVRVYQIDGKLQPERIGVLGGHTGAVRTVTFTRDGRSLATAADDKQVILRDAQTGNRVGLLAGLTANPATMAWSRNGRLSPSRPKAAPPGSGTLQIGTGRR